LPAMRRITRPKWTTFGVKICNGITNRNTGLSTLGLSWCRKM
jgi:hypothetical protein